MTGRAHCQRQVAFLILNTMWASGNGHIVRIIVIITLMTMSHIHTHASTHFTILDTPIPHTNVCKLATPIYTHRGNKVFFFIIAG